MKPQKPQPKIHTTVAAMSIALADGALAASYIAHYPPRVTETPPSPNLSLELAPQNIMHAQNGNFI